jgi:hypothetical protein
VSGRGALTRCTARQMAHFDFTCRVTSTGGLNGIPMDRNQNRLRMGSTSSTNSCVPRSLAGTGTSQRTALDGLSRIEEFLHLLPSEARKPPLGPNETRRQPRQSARSGRTRLRQPPASRPPMAIYGVVTIYGRRTAPLMIIFAETRGKTPKGCHTPDDHL